MKLRNDQTSLSIPMEIISAFRGYRRFAATSYRSNPGESPCIAGKLTFTSNPAVEQDSPSMKDIGIPPHIEVYPSTLSAMMPIPSLRVSPLDGCDGCGTVISIKLT